jgi:hypothetical protein
MRRALVGCETSGRVREALRRHGWDAWSCDLLPADDASPYHMRADVREVLGAGWELGIFHPPCTYLCNSGVRWLYGDGASTGLRDDERWARMRDAADLFRACLRAPIRYVAVENPIMHAHASALVGAPSQIVQPWHFGDPQMKATALWLVRLPCLVPTHIVGPPPLDPIARRAWARVHRASPGPERWKLRSVTFAGIAEAMADQWGGMASGSAGAGCQLTWNELL